MKLCLIITVCMTMATICAEDAKIPNVAICQNNVLGMKWGDSSAKVKERFPRMIGVINLSESEKLYIVNRTLGLVVVNNGLARIMYGDCLFDWKVRSKITLGDSVDVKFRDLSKGLATRMNYNKINESFGGNLPKADYQVNVDHKGLRYDMSFSSMDNGGAASFSLMSVVVSRVKAEKVDYKEVQNF